MASPDVVLPKQIICSHLALCIDMHPLPLVIILTLLQPDTMGSYHTKRFVCTLPPPKTPSAGYGSGLYSASNLRDIAYYMFLAI